MELMFHAYTNLGDYLSLNLLSIKKQMRNLLFLLVVQIMELMFRAYTNLGDCLSLNLLSIKKRMWYKICNHGNTNSGAEIPWLLPPQGSARKRLRFYSLSEDRVYNVKLPIGCRFCGYSKGWLIIVTQLFKSCPRISLLNPVSGAQLRLPSLRTIPCYEEFIHLLREQLNSSGIVYWIEVSSCPGSTADCIVAAIFNSGKVLALCKPGDEEWSVFEREEEELFENILFYLEDGRIERLFPNIKLFTPCPQ